MGDTTKRTLLAVVVFCLVGTIVGVQAISAKTPPPFVDDGTGITCSISGAVTFDPPLTVGAPGTSVITVQDKLTHCTGALTQFGITITGGVQRSVGRTEVETNCLDLVRSMAAPAFAMRTRYYVAERALVPPTVTTWAVGTSSLSKTTGHLVVSHVGVTSVTGSFSTGTGPAPSLTEVFIQDETKLLAECDSTTGVKWLSFSASGDPSSVTLG